MLVLSRRLSESFAIYPTGLDGPPVTITLVYLDGRKARIGIEAPRSMPVYRTELLPLTAEKPAKVVGGEAGGA